MPANPDKLIGIDLGTTFSVVAHLDSNGFLSTLPNRLGAPLTPSVVYLDGKTAIVGDAARRAASVDSSKVAQFVKRFMGHDNYNRPVDGRMMRPETLSAIILKKLKQDAERRIGPVSKAVITVPAFFDDTRRKATQDAGRIAGLEVLDIINEPTAAALAYAMEGQDRKVSSERRFDFPRGAMTALVYDLGGGTFDVTVVQLSSNRFETLATDGAVELGGKDWDDCIVEYAANQFQKQFGTPLFPPHQQNDPAQRQRRDMLGSAAEVAKVLLSDLPSAPIKCSYLGHELAITLTRAQFEELTAEKLSETRIVTDLVAKQANLNWDQIDRVLLVGGSTRMPMVKAMLRQKTGKEPDDGLDPDQVVARGAAIHAGIVAAKSGFDLEMVDELRQDLKRTDVTNVNAYSLGVGARRNGEDVSVVVIPKNTELSHAASKIFRTVMSRREIMVQIFEGEAPTAHDNICIGECLLKGTSELPSGSPIQVRLNYGSNGRIDVMALDMTSGQYVQTEIKRQSGLSEEQIGREKQLVDSLDIQ